MKKQTENTTQNNTPNGSEPPAVAGGSNGTDDDVQQTSNEAVVVPPAHAGGSDLKRLQQENEQLKATIRDGEAHRQITGELEKAGARSPGLLFATVKGDLQFDADGKLVNAAALVGRLTAAFPEQFGVTRIPNPIDAGAGRTVTPQLTRDALAKMKPSEIATLDWADVRRVLAAK